MRGWALRNTPFCWLILLLPLLLAPVPAPAVQQAMPADAVAFVSRVAELLREGEGDAVVGHLAPGSEGALDWLTQGRRRRRRAGWKAAPLLLPAAGGQRAEALVGFWNFLGIQSEGDHLHRLARTPAGWRIGAEILETETLGYRLRDHRLNVTYDLPSHGVTITDQARIERVGEKIGPVVLRLSSDMRVSSVRIAGRDVPFQSAPGFLAVAPPAARTFTVSLSYRGTVNHRGSDYVNEREAVLVSYWCPHIARLPATAEVTATVPRGWIAIGQGEQTRRVTSGETWSYTYRNEVPTSCMSLAAGRYEVTERQVEGRRLAVYQLRPNPDRAARGLDVTERALRFFETHLGRFPYSSYTMVETIGPFGGALEAYSFSTFGGGQFAGAAVHELAHTWWGGLVPNPYTRSQWNESFAVYWDDLFQRLTGPNPERRALSGAHSGDDRGRSQLRGYAHPIRGAYDTSNGAHAAVGYGKGARVLEMLEDLVTRPVLLRCMRAFLEGHQRGEAADWDDFVAAVRKTTGKDYGWFFDQWLNRGGVPVVRLANVKLSRSGDETVVSGELIQEGDPYRLHIPIVLEMPEGESLRQTVEARGSATPIRLVTRGTPKRLAVDPEGNTLLAAADVPGDANPLAHSFN